MSKGSEEQEGRRPAWTVRRGLPPKPSATLYPLQDPLQYCRARRSQGNADGPSCGIQATPYLLPMLLVQCSFSSIRQHPNSSSPPLLHLTRSHVKHSDLKHTCPPPEPPSPDALAANLSRTPGVTLSLISPSKWGIRTKHAPQGCYNS